MNKWIQSASNTKIDFRNPDPEAFKIEDIALGLARQARFAGQGSFFYSVAQHSVYVATQVSPGNRLHAILHDAAEAYMGDMPGPLKSMVAEFDDIEYYMNRAIYKGLELAPPSQSEWNEVVDVDRAMLNVESDKLFTEKMWHIDTDLKLDVRITPWDEQTAVEVFLTYYDAIRERENNKYGYLATLGRSPKELSYIGYPTD